MFEANGHTKITNSRNLEELQCSSLVALSRVKRHAQQRAFDVLNDNMETFDL